MAAACSDGDGTAPWIAALDPAALAPDVAQPESATARARIEGLPQHELAVLHPALATSITREGAFLRPELPAIGRRARARHAEVLLPLRADGPFRVTDTHTGMAIDVALVGAGDSPGEVAEGFVIYRRAHTSGAHIIHRPTAEGTEDYVHFDEAPGEEALRYEVVLNEHVAGLRLVSNTLEFLDAAGTPRLRMAPPWGVDAHGERFAVAVTMDRCAYDADPRGPWGRPLVTPGAARCTVHLQWGGGGRQYPVLVDPSWTTTMIMNNARYEHTTTVLSDGRVLVAGGEQSNGVSHAGTELYDPGTATFASTAPLITPRGFHTATRLANGNVLVAGGRNGTVAVATAEVYNPNIPAGMWTETMGPMSGPRQFHTASMIEGGRVLIAGGFGTGPLKTAEVYDPASGMWAPTSPMNVTRHFHTASELANGKILVVGGILAAGASNTAEVYDPIAGTWTPTGNLAVPHRSHTASVLPDGKVIVVAGALSADPTTITPVVEMYDPVQNQWTDIDAADLGTARSFHRATVLPSGKLLVAGGSGGVATLDTAEIYDPVQGVWSAVANMNAARQQHATSLLLNGTVLVTGGRVASATALNSAELFLLSPGEPCTAAKDCASGSCADGICCDTVCNGQCETCDGSIAGSTRGTCARTTGAAPANRPPCQGDSAACGFCDGISPECVYPDLTTQCASSCASGAQSVSVCDGNGDCKPFPTPIPCGAYACDGTTACKTDCAAAADCAPGFQCSTENSCVLPSVTCTDDHTLQDETGALTDCTPFACKGNSCLKTCTSDDDCAAPHICDATSKQCMNPSTGSANEAAGCACTVPAPARTSPSQWLAAVAFAGIIARRRLRRSHMGIRSGKAHAA
jgi:hypothetical protein